MDWGSQIKNQNMNISQKNNSTVIILTILIVLLGTTVFFRLSNRTHRISNIGPTQHGIWVGDVLPALPSYSWQEHDHSLVLAARVDCSHCKASAPLYRQLQLAVANATNRVGLIAVFPDSPDKIQAFFQQFNFNMPTIAGMPLERLAVSGTPTLLLTDSKGTVIRVWVGELDSEEQSELLAQLRSYLDAKAGRKS
jgi:thiol-disulfide isomerase/thioredoxin